jgi:uncharacterized membrane protein YeaQ/YmgE (transglycosylase-associated protein family)
MPGKSWLGKIVRLKTSISSESGGFQMEYNGWLYSMLIGLVAGAIAKFLMPGRDPGGCIITMLLGIGGSLLFTYVGKAVGLYQPGQAAGLIGAVVGAIMILIVYRTITK